MHITIFSYGTWGDTRPHVVLGMALQDAGHDVQVVASPAYGDWVRARGLEFCPLRVDIGEFSANAQKDVSNPIEGMKLFLRELPDMMTQMAEDTLAATRHSDAILAVEFGVSALMDVIKQNKLKMISINPAPLSPSREMRFLGFPPAPAWLPEEAYNNWTYGMLHRMQWMATSAPRNRLSKQLGYPKPKFKAYRQLMAEIPALTIVSPHVIPAPSDWPEHFKTTGYIFDDDEDWTPPQDLLDFLDAGDPPVYIGFGSMPDKSPQETTQMLIEGIQKSGKRGIILKGWAGFRADDIPDDIFILKYAPHNWLFPQMSAVIHHGGAGTTASGLLAGVPTCIVPQNGDQPFWGKHVQELGVGVEKIQRKKLSPDTLASAIHGLTSTPSLRENAQILSEKIKQEDGLAETLKWTEHFLKYPLNHNWGS